MDTLHPQLRDFIIFCVSRAGKEWPGICDEMANVAGQHLYNGLGHTELKQFGLFFGISNVDNLRRQVEQVVSQYEAPIDHRHEDRDLK
jgi:hypothetical protein